MARGRKAILTPDRVKLAIPGTAGVYVEIAKNLNLSRQTVFEFMQKFPELLEARREEEEHVKDKCESVLCKAINDGSLNAVTFYLKTKGKDRGYVEKTEVTTPRDEPIAIAVFPLGMTPTQVDFRDKKLLEQTAVRLLDDDTITVEVSSANQLDGDQSILSEYTVEENNSVE